MKAHVLNSIMLRKRLLIPKQSDLDVVRTTKGKYVNGETFCITDDWNMEGAQGAELVIPLFTRRERLLSFPNHQLFRPLLLMTLHLLFMLFPNKGKKGNEKVVRNPL